MAIEWEITKKDKDDNDIAYVHCASHADGFTVNVRYPRRVGKTVEVKDSEAARARAETWDGQGELEELMEGLINGAS